MSVPAARSRYRGQFVVSDIQNNKKWLCDLVWSWSKGDPLADWTLGGTTVPTIAADGQLDLFDNINLAAQTSSAYKTLSNSVGNFWMVFHCKFTRQADDSSVNTRSFISHIAGTTTRFRGVAILFDRNLSQTQVTWTNSNGIGPASTDSFIPAVNVEYSLDLLLSPSKALIFINGRLIGSFAVGTMGASSLAVTPINDWRAASKILLFYVEHDAGTISHYRIHDIKVGRYAGESSP